MRQFYLFKNKDEFTRSMRDCEAIYGRELSAVEIDRAWTIYSRVADREAA